MPQAQIGGLDVPGTIEFLYVHRDRLPAFVITDHPADWPDFYVARLRFTLPADEPSAFVIMDKSLERLRATMEALGLVCLTRSPDDPPVIVETWL